MFTMEDYATLTASQRKGRTTRKLVTRMIVIAAEVTAVLVVADFVEKKLDSSKN